MKPFRRPLLAAPLMPSGVEHTNENILAAMQKLRMPVGATLKKDGIRGVEMASRGIKYLYSRTMKRIPNLVIQERARCLALGMDVELWNPDLSYDEIESIVMSREHKDSYKIQFHLIDWYGEGGYMERVDAMVGWYKDRPISDVVDVVLPNVYICHDAGELFHFFAHCEQQEGEGICFRLLDSPYPQKPTQDNRSTLNEQYLVKLSRYVYEEGVVVGFEEQRDEAGIKKGTLGSIVVVQYDKGSRLFSVGSGWKRARGHYIWRNQDKYKGKTLTFKHKPHGQKNKPRSPIYVGFREEGF